MTVSLKMKDQRAEASVIGRGFNAALSAFEHIPYSLTAFLTRFSIAAVFWKSGQTKIEGFKVDLIERTMSLGIPRLSDSAVDCSAMNTKCRSSRRRLLRLWRPLQSMYSQC